MSKSEKTVDIFSAISWICPNCGHKNFEDLAIAELTPSEKKELSSDHGIDYHEFPELLAAPDLVECASCQECFRTDSRQDECISE